MVVIKHLFIFTFSFLLLLSCSSINGMDKEYLQECHHILDKRLARDNSRYDSFMLAFKLMYDSKAKVIVETGTARCGERNCAGDGCSTILLGNWAKKNGAMLYSIDNSEEHIASSKNGAKRYKNYIEFIQDDSIHALKNFPKTIDFLYLDSFDYDFDNPIPSQLHHLKEVIAAYPHLSPTCPIMIDDCSLPKGGKGSLAINYLIQRGWSVVYNGYQVILLRA